MPPAISLYSQARPHARQAQTPTSTAMSISAVSTDHKHVWGSSTMISGILTDADLSVQRQLARRSSAAWVQAWDKSAARIVHPNHRSNHDSIIAATESLQRCSKSNMSMAT